MPGLIAAATKSWDPGTIAATGPVRRVTLLPTEPAPPLVVAPRKAQVPLVINGSPEPGPVFVTPAADAGAIVKPIEAVEGLPTVGIPKGYIEGYDGEWVEKHDYFLHSPGRCARCEMGWIFCKCNAWDDGSYRKGMLVEEEEVPYPGPEGELTAREDLWEATKPRMAKPDPLPRIQDLACCSLQALVRAYAKATGHWLGFEGWVARPQDLEPGAPNWYYARRVYGLIGDRLAEEG